MRIKYWMAAALAAMIIVGCAMNRAVYNSLATSKAAADGSVAAYYDLVVRGEVATNGVPRVSHAYNMFQAAFGTAVELASLDTNSVTPQLVTGALSNLVWTITEVKGAQ